MQQFGHNLFQAREAVSKIYVRVMHETSDDVICWPCTQLTVQKMALEVYFNLLRCGRKH